jgi:hypothetical protein
MSRIHSTEPPASGPLRPCHSRGRCPNGRAARPPGDHRRHAGGDLTAPGEHGDAARISRIHHCGRIFMNRYYNETPCHDRPIRRVKQ